MRTKSASLLLSFLLAVLCTLPPIVLVLRGGVESVAVFKDFVVSENAYSGYDKGLELHATLLFVVCDFLLLPLLLWQREKILRVCSRIWSRYGRPFTLIAEKLSSFFHAPIFHIKNSTTGIILLGFLFLLLQAGTLKSENDALALFTVMGTYLALVALLRERPELFTHACMAGIGCYFSVMGVLVVCQPEMALFKWVRLRSIPATCLATLWIAGWLRRRGAPDATRIVALTWALAPSLLFALTRYGYIGGGVSVELYPSWFSGIFFNIFMGFLLCTTILAFFLRKYGAVFIFAALSVALYLSWHAPSPYIPKDLFHFGELTAPLHQWIQFGKKPFLDYHPVHGMCDYYGFALSHLFFDGSYTSINAGLALGKSLQAVLQILVLIIVCPHRYAWLLLAILMPDVGTRWLAVGLCLPLSFWLYQRCDAVWFLLWSGFSGMCCVFWNTPQGAAYCAALAPLIALKFWEQRKALPRPSAPQLAGAGILCIMVLALWPYLAALASTTLITGYLAVEAHGRSVLDGLGSAHWYWTVAAFLFLPFLAFLYIRALTSQEKFSFTTLLPISLTLFCLVGMNYAFLRYDNGARARLLSLVIIAASVTSVPFPRTRFRLGAYAFLAGALLLSSSSVFPTAYPRIYENQTYTVGKKFILPSDAEIKYIGNLGLGFIDPATLAEWKEFRGYLDKNGNKYAVLDGSLARHSIFNTENSLKYQTAFNTEGIIKQNDTLKRIDTTQLNTVLVPLHNPSLYYLQTQIFNKGFYPDALLSNKYLILKRGQKNRQRETSLAQTLLATRRMQALAHLPQVWGPACASLTEPAPIPYELTLENCVRTEKGDFVSQKGGSVEMVLHFKEPVSARDFQFLLLSAQTGGRNHQVRVTSPDIAEGRNGYTFWLGKRAAAVPLFMNYAWLFSPSLREIRIEIQDIHPRKDFSLDIAFRRFLPE